MRVNALLALSNVACASSVREAVARDERALAALIVSVALASFLHHASDIHRGLATGCALREHARALRLIDRALAHILGVYALAVRLGPRGAARFVRAHAARVAIAFACLIASDAKETPALAYAVLHFAWHIAAYWLLHRAIAHSPSQSRRVALT